MLVHVAARLEVLQPQPASERNIWWRRPLVGEVLKDRSFDSIAVRHKRRDRHWSTFAGPYDRRMNYMFHLGGSSQKSPEQEETGSIIISEAKPQERGESEESVFSDTVLGDHANTAITEEKLEMNEANSTEIVMIEPESVSSESSVTDHESKQLSDKVESQDDDSEVVSESNESVGVHHEASDQDHAHSETLPRPDVCVHESNHDQVDLEKVTHNVLDRNGKQVEQRSKSIPEPVYTCVWFSGEVQKVSRVYDI
jgi:hypothetical protein